jgi:hypothetical protein
MKTVVKILMFFVIAFSLSVFAQDKENYSNEPGYVDFGNLTSFMKSDKVTEVNIESYLLKMVSNLTEKNDPELSQMLKGLKLIKVYSFDANANNSEQLMNKIDKIDNSLINKNWDRIVKVRSPKENTNVYIKTTSDQKTIVGLVVTSLEKDGESAFINIVGNIDMDALGRLGDKFDIPSLENIHK